MQEGKTTILSVSDNLSFKVKQEYLKLYFGVGDFQPATIPRKRPWTIVGQPNDLPEGWVIWSPNLFANSSGYLNEISSDGTIITETVSKDTVDYFLSEDPKSSRFHATRVVFAKAKGDGWRFRGVFVPDYKNFTADTHAFRRVATIIKVTQGPEPVIELIDKK